MKTRTMNMSPDFSRVEGEAWSATLPSLVLEKYENGQCTHRMRVELTPVFIEDLAARLWEARGKYAKALEDMTKALKGD